MFYFILSNPYTFNASSGPYCVSWKVIRCWIKVPAASPLILDFRGNLQYFTIGFVASRYQIKEVSFYSYFSERFVFNHESVSHFIEYVLSLLRWLCGFSPLFCLCGEWHWFPKVKPILNSRNKSISFLNCIIFISFS